MNHGVQNVDLPSGCRTNIVTFSIRDIILRMVKNYSLL